MLGVGRSLAAVESCQSRGRMSGLQFIGWPGAWFLVGWMGFLLLGPFGEGWVGLGCVGLGWVGLGCGGVG